MTVAHRVRVNRGAFSLDAEVQVADGEVLALLGPNGAGKTTLLRALAGLDPLDDVRLADVGVVFQEHRLFPHLSAVDNVAFPLRCKGVRRPAARAVAHGWLERLGLAELASRRPAALSGGQAQRVALARALSAEPALLLLDEPLSSLDATARVEVRQVLRQELAAFTGPAVLVTHEPLDALALADRVLVLEEGLATQVGSPHELLSWPATPFVAALAGLNLLRGTASAGHVQLDGGGALELADRSLSGRVLTVVRPSSVVVELDRPRRTSARNVLAGRVTDAEQQGSSVRLTVAGPPVLHVDVTAAAVAELRLGPGVPVWLSVKASEIEAYPEP